MHFESFLSQKKPFSESFLHLTLRLFKAILPLLQTHLVSHFYWTTYLYYFKRLPRNYFCYAASINAVKPLPDIHVEPSHTIDSTPSGLVIFGHFSKAAEFLTPAGNPQPVFWLLNVFWPKDLDWCFGKFWDLNRASKIQKCDMKPNNQPEPFGPVPFGSNHVGSLKIQEMSVIKSAQQN